MKMVVVALLGSLIAGRLSGNLDTSNLSGLHKGFQRAINGRNTDRGDVFPGKSMDLIRE